MQIRLFDINVVWVEDFAGEFLGFPSIPWVSFYQGQNSTFRAFVNPQTMEILHYWEGEDNR